MYELDTNINIAIERRADQVRAVKAYGLPGTFDPAAPSWAADESTRRMNAVARVVTLSLAAATPIVLILVWGLLITH